MSVADGMQQTKCAPSTVSPSIHSNAGQRTNSAGDPMNRTPAKKMHSVFCRTGLRADIAGTRMKRLPALFLLVICGMVFLVSCGAGDRPQAENAKTELSSETQTTTQTQAQTTASQKTLVIPDNLPPTDIDLSDVSQTVM